MVLIGLLRYILAQIMVEVGYAIVDPRIWLE